MNRMDDLISRQAAIEALKRAEALTRAFGYHVVIDTIRELPSAQPDARLKKIADLVDGTIDHFDRDDAMDLLYQIKEVLKNERYNQQTGGD